MEIEAITTLISNMGFPIACVIALFWYLNKEREEHKAETQKLADAINNNTIAMEKILAKVGDDADDQGIRICGSGAEWRVHRYTVQHP